MKSYALYEKRTKTFYYAFYSISVIDKESFKFSKNGWSVYRSVEEALRGKEKLLQTISKEKEETIKYLNSYDTLRGDIPEYIKKADNVYGRFNKLFVVEIVWVDKRRILS